MPKPSSLPTWATDTNYPAGAEPEAGTATKVAPTSGQATRGWRPAAKPPAQEMNYWQNLVYQWIAYLDTGSLTGDVEIAGGLYVQNDVEIDGQLDVAGPIASDGNMSADDFKYTTAQEIVIGGGDFRSVGGSPHTAYNENGGQTGWTLSNGGDTLWAAIPVRAGDQITSYNCYFNKASTDATSSRIWGKLMSTPGTNAAQSAGDSDTATGYTSTTETGLTITALTGYQYYLVVSTAYVTGGDVFLGAKVLVKRP